MLVKLSDSANVGKRWCFCSVFINIYVVVKKVEQCFVGGGAISPSLSVNCIGLLFIFPSFWPFFPSILRDFLILERLNFYL